MIIGKTHLRLFPCRDGIYSTVWPGDIIIPIKRHVIVCFLILMTAVLIGVGTDSSMGDDSYKVYLDGISCLIDPIVIFM